MGECGVSFLIVCFCAIKDMTYVSAYFLEIKTVNAGWRYNPESIVNKFSVIKRECIVMAVCINIFVWWLHKLKKEKAYSA